MCEIINKKDQNEIMSSFKQEVVITSGDIPMYRFFLFLRHVSETGVFFPSFLI